MIHFKTSQQFVKANMSIIVLMSIALVSSFSWVRKVKSLVLSTDSLALFEVFILFIVIYMSNWQCYVHTALIYLEVNDLESNNSSLIIPVE